jgi:hypothetical protein
VIKLIEDEFPDALANASYTITDADQNSPAILLRTVDKDPAQLATKHPQEVEAIQKLVTSKPSSPEPRCGGCFCVVSIPPSAERDRPLFPITYFSANGADRVSDGNGRPKYFDVGLTSCNAIKISIDRPNISASLDERDVFGAQQQKPIERLMIPMYSDKIANGPSF